MREEKQGITNTLALPIGKMLYIYLLCFYNMNGFGIETMYDYYITMKSMFLVAKLFFHLSIIYASFTILLP
jgi:hypothetical protein